MHLRLWRVLSILIILNVWPAGNPVPAFADGPASETSVALAPDTPATGLDLASVMVGSDESDAETIEPPDPPDTPEAGAAVTEPDPPPHLDLTTVEARGLVSTRSKPVSYLDAAPSCTPLFPTVPPDSLANEQAIAESINLERVSRGLAPLSLTVELTQSSRLHSRDMADNNNQGHYGSDGSQPNQRITRACYQGTPGGEIIVWGYGDVSEVIGWWMNSPVHRAMILNPRFRDFGVGYAYNANSYYRFGWTVNFGAEY